MKKTDLSKKILQGDSGRNRTKKTGVLRKELDPVILAQSLREFRMRKNLSQTELAEKIGMEKGQLSKIEKGKFNLTLATINKIASALGAKINFDLEPI